MIDLNEAEKQALDFASRALQGEASRTREKIRQLVEAAAIMAGVSKPDLTVNAEALIAELYKTIGQRDMELSWLKKNLKRFERSG